MHRIRSLRAWTAVLVAAVAGASFVISYDSLRALSEAAGVRGWLPNLYPLTLDGLMVVATLAAVVLRDRRGRYYAAAVLGGGIALSVWGNAVHSTGRDGELVLGDVAAYVVSAVPAVALGLAVHLLVVVLRAPVAVATEAKPAPVAVATEAKPAPVAVATEAEPAPVAVVDDLAAARRHRTAAATSPRRRVTVATGAVADRRRGVAAMLAEDPTTTYRDVVARYGVTDRTASRDLELARQAAAVSATAEA